MSDETTYTVHVERDEAGYWIADVPAIPGAHTFGKTLQQLDRRIPDLIATWVDVPVEDVRYELDIAGIGGAVREARAAREAADRMSAQASRLTREVAIALVNEQGMTMRDAGRVLGLSYQRVDQLVRAGYETGRMSPTRSKRAEGAATASGRRSSVKATPKKKVRVS